MYNNTEITIHHTIEITVNYNRNITLYDNKLQR